MDPVFTRLLFRVMVVGGTIGFIGAAALFFAFRALAPAGARGREFRAVVLIAALLAFVMLCCAVLLRISLLG